MIELQTVSEAAREWLVKASRDLKLVHQTLASDDPLTDSAAYHCQQAAEKAIKGLLAYYDEPFPKTHLIAVLAPLVMVHEPSLEELLGRADRLSDYAWLTRYPGVGLPTLDEAQALLKLAEDVLGAVLACLPAEAQP